jgi:putative ABC transport system permease protein
MALAAIAIGVSAIIVAGGFIEDVYVQFREAIIHSQYGHLQVYRAGYSAHGTQRPTEYLIEDPAPLIRSIRGIPGVKSVLPRLRFVGTAGAGGGDLPIFAEGIDPGLENALGTWIHVVEGRLLRNEDRNAVIVGEGVASSLHAHTDARLSINIVTREGALNTLDFQIVGVFRSYSKEFDQHAIRVTLNDAQDLLATRGVNEIVVELNSTAAAQGIADTLRSDLKRADYEVKTWFELADFYAKTVGLFDRQFGFLQVVLLLMIVLSVTNIINTTVYERLSEFGTMLALGNRPGEVVRLIMCESIVLGTLGSMIGVALGSAFALAISAVGIPMPPPPNMDSGYVALIRIVPTVVLGGFAVGILATFLAGIPPSVRAARTPAVEALRHAI